MYSAISPEKWEQELKGRGVPEHLTAHLLTMGSCTGRVVMTGGGRHRIAHGATCLLKQLRVRRFVEEGKECCRVEGKLAAIDTDTPTGRAMWQMIGYGFVRNQPALKLDDTLGPRYLFAALAFAVRFLRRRNLLGYGEPRCVWLLDRRT